MTAQNRTTLKGKFEQGDTPQGTDYEDMIDSALNVADTSAQAVASNLFSPELQTTKLSAAAANVTGTVTANAVSITTIVSANSAVIDGNMTTDTLTVAGAASASSAAFGSLTVAGQPIAGTLTKGRGIIYITASAATSIGSSGTFELINGTFSSRAVTVFSARSAGTFVYKGTPNTFISIAANLSMTDGNNKLIAFRCARNGTTFVDSEIERFVSTGGDVGALAVFTYSSAATDDVFGVYVANKTDSTDVTVEKITFAVTEI